MTREKNRAWIVAAVACAAMLLVPVAGWIAIPKIAGPRVAASSAKGSGASSFGPAWERRAGSAPLRTSEWGAGSEDGERAAGDDVVRGKVLDPDGHLVKGASVTCVEREPPLAATTDDEGAFQLPGDASGCHAVARHVDFFPSDPVALAIGANTLRLAAGGAIQGVIADEGGAPVPSFTIGVESYRGVHADRSPVRQTRPFRDEGGAFTWDKLPPGRYVIAASAEGKAAVRSDVLEVESGRTTSVRIAFPRGANLSGRVTDATTRRPIAGASIALDGLTTTRVPGVAPVKSGDDGSYSLDGAPPGPFSVRVTREGYRPRIVPGVLSRGAPTIHLDVELEAIVDGGPSGDQMAGIGAVLDATPKGVIFARLLPGGPAEHAGILAGDVIERIDGADFSALTVVDCMQALRGRDGSRVMIQVDRSGQRIDFTVERRALDL